MSSSRFSLFVPHGSPMFALDPGQAGAAMSRIATQYREPRAIVIISPHWTTELTTVGTAARLPTIHDFHGFDQALYPLALLASAGILEREKDGQCVYYGMKDKLVMQLCELVRAQLAD